MGGTPSIQTPTPPAAPSTADAVNAWVQSMPTVFAEQQRQAPLEAQQQIELLQQYGAPYAQEAQRIQELLYPGVSALSEKLATTASQGMDQGLPDWAKQTYFDTFRSQLGENALSGAGADYMSRGMMQQEQDWKKYYNDLALSVSGKQPLVQPSQPQTTNYASTFTPQSVMSYTGNNYGNYSNAYTGMYGANANYASGIGGRNASMINSAIGAIGGAAGSALGYGGALGR